jgi:DNA-binding GntR family transcriptional regulator
MSLSAPIEPPASLTERVFARLADAIVRGELNAGAQIKEAVLARDLGVSRGTLRAAIDRLAAYGVVVREHNLGARVIDVNPVDLDDLFAVREALEGMSARQAAARISDDQLTALAALLDPQDNRFDDSEDSATHDFHLQVARASGNQRLVRILGRQLHYNLRIYRLTASYATDRSASALEEHTEILRALQAHDGDRAEQAMRRHIAGARAVYEPIIEAAGRPEASEGSL